MDFREYSTRAWATAIFPKSTVYPVLGLCGEAGEVAELVKKAIRVNDGDVDRVNLAKELGDVLWYINAVARTYLLDLDTIAKENLSKLESRQARGVLQGSGDNR